MDFPPAKQLRQRHSRIEHLGMQTLLELSGAQLSEILSGFGHHIGVEFHNNAACGGIGKQMLHDKRGNQGEYQMVARLLKRRKTQRDCRHASWVPCKHE
jgi:hypothetical protein